MIMLKCKGTRQHNILTIKGNNGKQNNWFQSFLTKRKQYVSIDGFYFKKKTANVMFHKAVSWDHYYFYFI